MTSDGRDYTSLVNEARAITDGNDARLAAFAKAEKHMIGHALVIPCCCMVNRKLTCINEYSKVYCAYGIQVDRHVNWETNDEIYTTDDFKVFAEQ